MNDFTDLLSIRLDSARRVQYVPLIVGILQNDDHVAEVLATALKKRTRWRILPFDSFEHARRVALDQNLHVFLTHWHIGTDHNVDSKITRLVQTLRERRGGPGVGSGPLLAASFNPDTRSAVSARGLIHEYDLFFMIPFDLDTTILAICARLFQMLPQHFVENERYEWGVPVTY